MEKSLAVKGSLTQDFVDNADKHSYKHLREFSKYFETIPMGYSGAQVTLIYEKNLKSKISCQIPFNLFWSIESDSFSRYPRPVALQNNV
jgi:hypothetical protein